MLTPLFSSKLFKPNQHCSQNLVEFRMLSEQYVLLAAAANVVIFSERSGRRRRRFWVRPSPHSRQRYTGRDLLRDLNCDDCGISISERRLSGSVKNSTRISSSDFEFLFNNIGRTISKQDMNYRNKYIDNNVARIQQCCQHFFDVYRSLKGKLIFVVNM
jgi:hypothetical protein